MIDIIITVDPLRSYGTQNFTTVYKSKKGFKTFGKVNILKCPMGLKVMTSGFVVNAPTHIALRCYVMILRKEISIKFIFDTCI